MEDETPQKLPEELEIHGYTYKLTSGGNNYFSERTGAIVSIAAMKEIQKGKEFSEFFNRTIDTLCSVVRHGDGNIPIVITFEGQ